MAGHDFLVYMQELSASVVQEELALYGKYSRKDVYEQHEDPEKEQRPILVNKNGPVRDQKPQLSDQPESHGEQDCDGEDEGVRNHFSPCSVLRIWERFIPEVHRIRGSGRDAAEQRRPSRSASGVSRGKSEPVGSRVYW